MHQTALFIRHIPALYFAFANCVGLVLALLRGNRALVELYGLPSNIFEVPETWPVWQAGQGRIILLGLMMHYFYWRGQYAECDALLMGVAFLGFNDFLVTWDHGNLVWAWCRIVSSIAFASTGYFGLTQDRDRARKARTP
ncbi:uncharacterized protein F4807DRAFT_463454 [Annulohypoxylon truncatum]|uniref:uncharacterized protein n=1 Tax=Annulohypoxylon truncatum TaxID=327061 RepID=UPI002007DEAF|nr:uncharacterized protein F4807DRAFT_463454 [Annulohypoxylon truncatum]KAI1206765.1 hypothetical protein F4807DRAFT_463454 [Annulohypoxylon truncatum]